MIENYIYPLISDAIYKTKVVICAIFVFSNSVLHLGKELMKFLEAPCAISCIPCNIGGVLNNMAAQIGDQCRNFSL
jgi:hypothetical protein